MTLAKSRDRMKLAGHPGVAGGGSVIDDVPGSPAREAMDGVLARRIDAGKLVGLAFPAKLARTNAIGKGKQHRKADARRLVLLEHDGIVEENLTRRAGLRTNQR